MKPVVSIIVPVYNVEKYLKRCLDSLVNQTLKNIEILIVNDGSPDNSQKIIDKYVEKYPNLIKSFIKKNGGQGSARNFAIKKAKGQYIMYVDSDDFIDKMMAETLYNEAIKNDNDIVVCGNKIFNEDYQCIEKESAYSFNDKNNIMCNFLFGKMAVWNKLFKKELILNNQIDFRSKVWYEDVDFNVKCLFASNKISFVDEPFYNYLLREGSTMNNSNIKRNLELLDSFNEIINFCNEKKIFNKYYDELEFLCVYHMYICGITRIINTSNKMKDKIKIIKKYIMYLENNFKNFKKNRYIRYLSKSKKIIYFLIKYKQYYIIQLLFKIKNKFAY